ncbi:hypothetical protein NPIL_152261 [Nephila pilipes]|uniref:Uncharacterized protein n=1 Tax=Nephila pilipes TaxID=299642 RepID=A0A8X6NK53_NEPPI|nr:hypothetical protein NPIL_152261 [Nephila pilipes]
MKDRSEKFQKKGEKRQEGSPILSAPWPFGQPVFCQRTKESSDFFGVSPEARVEYREKRFYEMPDLRIRRSKTYAGQTSRKLSAEQKRTPTSKDKKPHQQNGNQLTVFFAKEKMLGSEMFVFANLKV